MRARAAVACALLSLAPAYGLAHAPSDAYLHIDLRAEPVSLRLEVALADLEDAVGVDADGNGAISWGELRRRAGAAAALATAGLAVVSSGGPCRIALPALQASRRLDRGYAVLSGTVTCPHGAGPERLDYGLLFDLDATHRGLVRVVDRSGTTSAALTESRRTMPLAAADAGPWHTLASFWRDGVWHVWQGLDHLLFLIALLAPIALGRDPALDSARARLGATVGVVTAFTLAHSLTLALATLGLVTLPARVVETVIAATVLLAALDNLRPIFGRGRVRIVFVLGLVHGLGFAGALDGLGVARGDLALALLGFNLGVESGQLVVVAVVLPVLQLASRAPALARATLTTASWLVGAVATVWIAERGLGVALLAG